MLSGCILVDSVKGSVCSWTTWSWRCSQGWEGGGTSPSPDKDDYLQMSAFHLVLSFILIIFCLFLKFFFVCECGCVCVGGGWGWCCFPCDVCGCTCLWGLEASLRCCSSRAVHFVEVGGSFSHTDQFIEAGWPVSQRELPSVCTPPALGVQVHAIMYLDYDVGFGDPTQGPPIQTASDVLTEPPPQFSLREHTS